METVVNKLLDIDKQARRILDEANAYRDQMLAELEQEKKQLEDSFTARANYHIENARTSYASEADEKITAIASHHKTLLAALDLQYETQHKAWEDQLFRQCGGR